MVNGEVYFFVDRLAFWWGKDSASLSFGTVPGLANRGILGA